jgi:hypothetical protein
MRDLGKPADTRVWIRQAVGGSDSGGSSQLNGANAAACTQSRSSGWPARIAMTSSSPAMARALKSASSVSSSGVMTRSSSC